MQIIETIYENGAFWPLGNAPLPFVEGDRVRLTVDAASHACAPNVLELAAQVYAGLSEEEIEEIEQIALDRANFFSPRNE